MKFMNKWGNVQVSDNIKKIIQVLSENNPNIIKAAKRKLLKFLMYFLKKKSYQFRL